MVLMVKAGPIANRILGGSSPTSSPWDMTKLEGAALCVLGWYLLADALADGAGLLGRAYLIFQVPPPSDQMRFPQIEYSGLVCATIAKSIIGVACIFGYRRIVATRNRLLAALSSSPVAK
jgi:hypothetical protein